MKTIETKYLACTNTKPARIVATDGDNRIIVGCEQFGDKAHMHAAKLLRDRLNWPNAMYGGHTKRGMVFVFADPSITIPKRETQ